MEQSFLAASARGVVLLGLCLVAGCATAPPRRTLSAPPGGPITGIVFAADGAGGFRYTTETLAHTIAEERLGLCVVPVNWSHGTGRILADHWNWCNIRASARELAVEVQTIRARYPTLPIYFVGHSSGTAVILEAAAELPCGSLDRIVLLAPSVSPSYDLRPALAASRCGIDAFISKADWVTGGLAMRLFGTVDGHWSAAAGRVGFCRPADPACACLYSRLREHFWDEGEAWTGHRGGHYGYYAPTFVRCRILPLLRVAPRE